MREDSQSLQHDRVRHALLERVLNTLASTSLQPKALAQVSSRIGVSGIAVPRNVK
jgi:hypothetical protein